MLESEIGALMRRLAAARDTADAASLQQVRSYAEARQSAAASPVMTGLEQRVRASGLFEPEVYLSLNPDRAAVAEDPWRDFLQHGLREGLPFTSPETVARLLAEMDATIRAERYFLTRLAETSSAAVGDVENGAPLRRRATKIAVLCSSLGNFFMRDIADLLTWGLQAEGIDAVQRDQTANRDEPFDLRVFVAPHEFFWLGEGNKWREVAGAAGSVLYNVEQPQTQWFCRAFPLLLDAPLVLDINLQTALMLRRAGCKTVHFMPGHLPSAPSAMPYLDISGIPLAQGYAFARRPYNWLEQNRLDERPIDLLFIGARTPRRNETLVRLQPLVDRHRFWCVCRDPSAPFTATDGAAREYGWALAQRAKIVLNLHRDWIGSFEWPRMVMQGFWQGACVVSDPGQAAPLFAPGIHYLEENLRHIGELVRWLLEAEEGREKLDRIRNAGYHQACSVGSMHIALGPVLEAFVAALQV
ncbi:MAG: hypothetical protein JO162_14690 [Alphaproteobacteria bacterium]|nr:hypothetical protein [Alphaproteobacteria bacterium]MBV9587011.1 hypothetical protein [Alphaproteobacteria bacterium]MBV9967562.1 hypothetical protein [Alphaproteobacteria bacterium]